MRRLLLSILVLLSAISALPAAAAAAARAPVLARGAALHGAKGVMFDRHVRLFRASVTGREIVVMHPQPPADVRTAPAKGHPYDPDP